MRILSGLLGLDEDRGVYTAPPEAEPFARPEPAPPAPDAPVATPEPERPYHPAFEAEVREELPPEPEPHLDDEPELVAEFAESGAGEGAHAELHVDEPWEGYRSLTASEITRRVGDARAEELAVIQLYEATHRGRRTVLDAVERRSRQLANEPGSRRPQG